MILGCIRTFFPRTIFQTDKFPKTVVAGNHAVESTVLTNERITGRKGYTDESTTANGS